MIAMAGLLLALSIAGNVIQLYIHSKKPKPPKQLKSGSKPKGLLGQSHVLEEIYSGYTEEGNRRWFFTCSCGIHYTRKDVNNEAKAIELWQEHAALYKEIDPDSENARLKKEIAELKNNCICKDL